MVLEFTVETFFLNQNNFFIMKITPDTHLFNLQLAFEEKFPKLKIEFFKSKHDKNEISPLTEEILSDLTVKELNPDFQEKFLLLFETEKVSAFERRMEEEFGLHVQVLRKSGSTWIQTSVTDDWTMLKQEEHAV